MKIFGTTNERKIATSLKVIPYLIGKKRFAFLPTRLRDDGSVIWLESYWAVMPMAVDNSSGPPEGPPFYFEEREIICLRKREHQFFYGAKEVAGRINTFMVWHGKHTKG